MTVHKIHTRYDESRELVIYDGHEPCPYLPNQTARLPLRLPRQKLTPEYFDECMAKGDRRNGPFLYRTACPACKACEPIRIDVEQFKMSRAQRRVKRRGDRELTTTYGDPIVDAERVKLFNKHRNTRGLALRDRNIDEQAYSSFLVQSCCKTVEISFRVNRELIGVAICDVGAAAVSAVYCYFDPDFGHLSPGTYSIVKHIELCGDWSKQFLYLGLYVAESTHMSYKAGFLPHQRLIDGKWTEFQRVQ